MTQIINLRQARKRQKRAEKETQAAANRTKFGRGKADRKRDEAEETRASEAFEGHRLADGTRADED